MRARAKDCDDEDHDEDRDEDHDEDRDEDHDENNDSDNKNTMTTRTASAVVVIHGVSANTAGSTETKINFSFPSIIKGSD